jgi:hypothetical protein
MKVGALKRESLSQKFINEGPRAMNTALLVPIMYRERNKCQCENTEANNDRKKKIEEARDCVGLADGALNMVTGGIERQERMTENRVVTIRIFGAKIMTGANEE